MKNKNAYIIIGIITAVVMIAIGQIAYATGQFYKPGMSYLVYIPMAGGIIWEGMVFSKYREGFVTFGEVLASGMKMTVVMILLITAWHLFTIVAMPERKEKAMATARHRLEAKQNRSSEQIAQVMSISEKVYYPVLIFGEIFGKAFFGLVFSLLASAIAEKKGPRPYVPLSDNDPGYQ